MLQIVSAIRSIRLVITDWSGVVSDDEKVAYAVNNEMLADYDLPQVSYDAWRRHTHGGSWKELFAKHGIHDTDALAASFEKHFELVAAKGIKPTCIPDAPRFLESIARERLAVVVSSHRARFLNREIEEYGLWRHVNAVYGSVHDKAGVMRRVLSSCDMRPEEAMYVADMTYDIEHARKAGVMAVAVASGYHSREQLQAANPDLLVDSLTELLTFFR